MVSVVKPWLVCGLNYGLVCSKPWLVSVRDCLINGFDKAPLINKLIAHISLITV